MREGDAAGLDDRIAATDVVERYVDAVDGRRWEILDEIFTPDVIWTWPDGRETRGRDELIDELRTTFAHAGPSHCIYGSYRVSIDGDTAEVKVHRRSYFTSAAVPGRFMESLGDFRAHLVRRDSRWWIDRFAESVFVRRGTRDVFAAPPR